MSSAESRSGKQRDRPTALQQGTQALPIEIRHDASIQIRYEQRLQTLHACVRGHRLDSRAFPLFAHFVGDHTIAFPQTPVYGQRRPTLTTTPDTQGVEKRVGRAVVRETLGTPDRGGRRKQNEKIQ